MEIFCPEYIKKAMNLLEQSGYEAYIVGGCVRDAIMNRTANDWDMTTSAEPRRIIDVFADYRTIPTGIKHGTVTVIIDGAPIEITTMRVDGEYTDSRRPDSVSFTSDIVADLGRRDFTVNAIASDLRGNRVDPYLGEADIEKKTIRCVGDPDKRFNEDALRIIRALRFASVLGFEIEENTAKSIIKNYRLLTNVAYERIRAELIKLLMGDSAERILSEFKEVIFFIIPELSATDGFLQHTPYHIYDVWTHTLKVISATPKDKDLRVAALLHDIGKPDRFRLDSDGIGHFKGHPKLGAEMARNILKRLRFSNAEIEHICSLILIHDERPNGDDRKLARLVSDYSPETVRDMLVLFKADTEGKNPLYRDSYIEACELAIKQLDSIVADGKCIKVNELKIDGREIAALGFEGREIGKAMDALRFAVIDGKIKNDRYSLIIEAERIIKDKIKTK